MYINKGKSMKKIFILTFIYMLASGNTFAAAGAVGEEYVDASAAHFIRGVMGQLRSIDPEAKAGFTKLEVDGKNVFAISKRAMTGITDFRAIRNEILTGMSVKKSSKIIQIVGDSKEFSVEGSLAGRAFLDKHLADADVVEYGYTSHNADALKGPTRCVNALVSNYIVENDLGAVTIANIVGHSIRALEAWGCKVPYTAVENYVLVYNGNFDEGEFTKFGDDTPISDGVMDELLLLDGGMQSLRQTASALERGIKVFGITGLRNHDDKLFVSGAALLLHLKRKFEADSIPSTSEEFKGMLEGYFASFKDFDKTRSDADTKKALMDQAIEVLSKDTVYPRIADLVSIKEM